MVNVPTNAKTQPIYSNHILQAPDGTPIARIGADRSEWYLERGLASVVRPFPFRLSGRFPFVARNDAPFTIRLNSQPKGRGHAGDEYYLSDKENKCVVCGKSDGINKHHVIPRTFRRQMPERYKSRTSHDVVVLCIGCHTRYETLANARKTEIATSLGYRYSVPKVANLPEEAQREFFARKAAYALLKNRATIPQAKVESLEATIRGHLGDEPLTDEAMEALVAKTQHYYTGYLGDEMSKYVLGRVDIDEFCLGWRQHFVETMKPQYLPSGWSVRNPVCQPN